MKVALWLCAAAALVNPISVTHVVGQEQKKAPSLADGFYLVVRSAPKKQDLVAGKNQRLIARDNLSPKGKVIGPPEFLIITHRPVVPLDLARKPDVHKEKSGGLGVYLELKPGAAAKLQRFTKNNNGARVAVIISNRVVTTHHVRGTIRGGKLKITCCADDRLRLGLGVRCCEREK